MSEQDRTVAERIVLHLAHCSYWDRPGNTGCTCAREERIRKAIPILTAYAAEIRAEYAKKHEAWLCEQLGIPEHEIIRLRAHAVSREEKP